MGESERPRTESRPPWGGVGQFMGHGLTWALATGFFLLIGWWVDGGLGTTPLFTIVGAFVGGAAGFYSLYYHVIIEPRKRNQGSDT